MQSMQLLMCFVINYYNHNEHLGAGLVQTERHVSLSSSGGHKMYMHSVSILYCKNCENISFKQLFLFKFLAKIKTHFLLSPGRRDAILSLDGTYDTTYCDTVGKRVPSSEFLHRLGTEVAYSCDIPKVNLERFVFTMHRISEPQRGLEANRFVSEGSEFFCSVHIYAKNAD